MRALHYHHPLVPLATIQWLDGQCASPAQLDMSAQAIALSLYLSLPHSIQLYLQLQSQLVQQDLQELQEVPE